MGGCGTKAPPESVRALELLKSKPEIAKHGVAWACDACGARMGLWEKGTRKTHG